MAKTNNGKSLEKTIQLFEETFKDSKNTQVLPSSKLVCESGIEREFDVLIKSKINGIDICIAIECKDYGKKVSIDRIDGFKGKCSTIKEINKMVFVSANGFQSGALIQAKKFGIDILTAEQVSLDYIESLISNIAQFNLEIAKKNLDHKISVASIDANVDLFESIKTYENELIEYNTGRKIKIIEFIKKTIESLAKFVDELALKHYVKYRDCIETNSYFIVPLGLDIPLRTLYFEDKDSNKIDVVKLEFEITVTFKKIISENSGRVIKNDDNSIQAHSIRLKIDDNTESEIIIKPDNNFSFFYTKNKQTIEFTKLSSFDPITNEVVNLKQNKNS